jgi:hypothetical protein
MDEVDGMGGSDRGGIPELIKVIKGSRNPIICICNDRQCQKIRRYCELSVYIENIETGRAHLFITV